MADIDGDGKIDLLTPHGWFKNIDADQDKWEWQGEWDLEETGFPIIGYDVNKDGKMDLIYSRGHSYGLYWLEQQRSATGRKWVKHTIDESYSQIHVLKLVDLDGDGQPELLAGKRYRGHDGERSGFIRSAGDLLLQNQSGNSEFTRYPISLNGTAGAGTQFLVEDLDGDGDLDIATAGKTGVHFFENLKVNKVPKTTREKQLLLDKNWPFPGEGSQVEWQRGKRQ